jgi:7-carboxy-7-deazaguanine synthase
MRISEIIEHVRPYQVKHVLVTGGEPLLQRHTPTLVESLKNEGYQVSIETHGEVSIAPVVENARIVMDIKTPSSGMCRGGYLKNLKYLKPTDEIKFVITSPEDYVWAKDIVLSGQLPTEEVLFSPVVQANESPGSYQEMDAAWLAGKILEDRLPVRLQVQLHKILWGTDKRGV